MQKKISSILFIGATVFISIEFISCSKSSPGTSPGNNDACAGKNIVISVNSQPSAGCQNDGSITATATGSSGFTYKLSSSGVYQASGSFTNIASGSYTVFAKDAAGCETSQAVTVGSGAAGPLFTQVKSLMTARCQSCHNNTIQNGGMNWTIDCNIVANKARIKVRAVDEGSMPPTGPLSQAEKNIITNWINAGGKLSD